MPSVKVCASLILLSLLSCTATFKRNSEATTAQATVSVTPTLTPSQSAQATPSIKADGSVINFDKIDPTLIAEGAKFSIQLRTESSSNCRHIMQYPQVSGLADTALQAELNQFLRLNMIEQMRIEGDLLEGDRCPRASLRDAQNRPRLYTWTFGCETHFAESRLVSIVCGTFTLPGAYPHPEILSVTFDLKTGKIYELAELFKPDSNYPVRLAILMRDAWWEDKGPISFPFSSFEADPPYKVEARPGFRFYFQEQCDQVFWNHQEEGRVSPLDPSGSPPEICMVIPNLGGGASRNYRMPVRMGALEEILDTSGALSVLAERIDERWQPR